MKSLKIIELIVGIFILLIGLLELISLIGVSTLFEFESAYTSIRGFKPLWMYSLGFILAGIACILDSFNKKSRFDFKGENYKRVK